MKLLSRAHATLADVSDATTHVIDTTEWATVALVAVAGVSLFALLLGVLALTVLR